MELCTHMVYKDTQLLPPNAVWCGETLKLWRTADCMLERTLAEQHDAVFTDASTVQDVLTWYTVERGTQGSSTRTVRLGCVHRTVDRFPTITVAQHTGGWLTVDNRGL